MVGPNFYGLSLSFGIFISFWLTAVRAKRRGLSPQVVWNSLPWVLGFGLVGARLYHVLNFLPFYLDHLFLIPQVWLGGLGIFGGIFGGLIGFLLKFKNQKSKIKIMKYLDAVAPLIPLAQAVGRVGNIFNGENLPFAYWEIVTNLLIFIFLILIDSNVITTKAGIQEPGSRVKPGMTDVSGRLFFLYLFFYSSARFILEFFRADSPWIFGPLTVAQWVSLVVISVSIYGLVKTEAASPSLSHPDPGSRY